MDAANGAVVLIESIDEGAHAVIPELDDAAVKTGEDPWALGVKAQAFHSIALGLEFRQHFQPIVCPPMIGDGEGMERSENDRNRIARMCIVIRSDALWGLEKGLGDVWDHYDSERLRLLTKQIVDEYQKTVRTDIWSSHYEKMQEHLKKLKEINRNLMMEIRQRRGESLNDLGYEQMVNLIEDMDNSMKVIREKKYKVISSRIDTSRKKLRNVEEIHRGLVLQFDARQEDPHYGLVENEGDYNSMLGFPHGGPRIIAVRLPPNNHHPHPHHHHHHHHHHPSLHSGTGASDLTTFALLE
ncbi:hypothetical protein SASPL_131816 [Salvia splendens]|uniref:K-box domain-containing protein n=1 Tax=Salvia splendens TaxID=180675 RepID=A0A8X8ZLB7_SALSN|nr:hypothetical protein SASPL_131816 [Salvia splendens]